jgi:Arc/MetJ-type ribon-helix-helix transcriptional regulator
MMKGMTAKAKIAVTLPTDLVESARSAVQAGRASSVSAYVAGALEERVKLDELDALLAEMLAETGGPLTEAERAEIDREAGWRSGNA